MKEPPVSSSRVEARPRSPTRLARPSGGYAMLALDQREAMRAMFAAHQDEPVTDAQLTEFKLVAVRVLTPYASGVLVDRQFAWDAVVERKAVAPACGLIAAADALLPDEHEPVADVAIDYAVVPERVRDQGAVAMKLLVLWRPDDDPSARRSLVGEFLRRCHAAGLVSIIEPVARAPRDGRAWDREDSIVAAAKELGSVGADIYKAEVPYYGQGDPDAVRRRCEQISDAVAGPWVVLSSGVPAEIFPTAVALACRSGASGFLAGRAIWASVIGSDDYEGDLRRIAVPRLQRLCDVVDEHVRR
jgi:sulfofructosephosphate aldolase